MLNLETKLTLNAETLASPNLANQFSKQDLNAIGGHVWEGYNLDMQSRAKWEKRTEAAMDLAMQLQKDKNFPWPNCSNIAFPLVTISAMQFHARAYPTIIQGTDVVKMRVVGPDPNGFQTKRAERVSTHMSYQVLEEDSAWEEQHDRALLILSVVGSIFIKTYYDARLLHNVSELVLSKDLVINYWAKSVEQCSRKTHRIQLSRNDIRERVLSEVFCDVLEDSWYAQPAQPQQTTQQQRADQRTGQRPEMNADETTPFIGLEQHCLLDLDDDGYDEPYIVTIEETSKTVLRIVSRINSEHDIKRVPSGPRKDEIISVQTEEYFTKYTFLPSPDGGIYDMGFGVLLGPLNESANSLINQLVDSGTMSNTAGGFLGRGAKIRGGVYTFAPFSWNRVDSSGDDLRKSIFPLPVRDPSPILFQLLSFIVNYTNRISGATDTMVGENPGQNTPAQTTQTMVEMGMKIYNAIFKRVWRSMKEEFRKLYILNAYNMPATGTSFGKDDQTISRQDYLGDPTKVVPAADPNITSESQGLQQALMLKQMSTTTPGYNLEEVERRVLKRMKVDDIDTIFPGPGKPGATPPSPDPKMAIAQMKLQSDQASLQLQHQQFMLKLQDEMRLTTAQIAELEAKAEMELEKANGQQAGQQLAAFDAYLGLLKLHKDTLAKHVQMALDHQNAELDRQHEQQLATIAANATNSGNGQSGAVGSMASRPSNGSTNGMGTAAA